MFAFTSLDVKYDKELARRNCGIYTFRVQGQMYNFIDDLVPSNEKPRNLQLYFYDHDNVLANRMACSTRINESIVKKLMDILKIDEHITYPVHQRLRHYGLKKILETYLHHIFEYIPTTKNVTKRRAYCEHEQFPSISNMCSVDGFLDMEDKSLQKRKRKRDTVSCRKYYCYKFQLRDNETNEVLHCGRIFQQFIVDVYIKLETQRLDFFSFNPDLFRIEVLQGLLDILRCGEKEVSKIGKKTFLPVTFIGGSRDMRRRYMDAIALVQYFGKPDFSITMTCNPAWSEIKEHLSLADEVQNIPDLVSRVFRAKVEELKMDILKRQIFGSVAAFMYTIEFQKRGLPHAHFLIILADEDKLLTPESYDKFVCAELPDSKKDRDLYSLVIKHMMHGPCGKLNPTNICMKNNNCKFKYPKDFAEQTSKGKNSYPIKKRRRTGEAVEVRATNYQMPYCLRRLFAALLVYCNPANPTELWKQFEDSMSEDFKILPNMNAKDIRFMALNHINDILHLMGHDINEYNLIPEKIKPSATVKETNDCHFERNIIVREEDLLLERKLNTEQRKAYVTILNRIFSNKSGAFFIDRPGGTGKTFLYRALLSTVQSKGFVALAKASSGVAASILPGGRTAHSRFKFSVDIDE
ncbi:uncharacterized protein [Nicotiana sylvestris]|uniref:uncharacterized protein n=1 Tax=Nicotiana sylvestris TaxID=4096 RepID=UPI00388CDC5A